MACHAITATIFPIPSETDAISPSEIPANVVAGKITAAIASPIDPYLIYFFLNMDIRVKNIITSSIIR